MLGVRPYFNIYPHRPRTDGVNPSRCRKKGTSEPKWMGWDRAICFHSAVLRTLITVYLGPVASHLCILKDVAVSSERDGLLVCATCSRPHKYGS